MNTAAKSRAMELRPHKAYRTRQSGSSAKEAKSDINKQDNKKPNPKAFGFTSSVNAKRSQMRATEKEQRRLHSPTIDRSHGEPPPYVVVVEEPPRCTKTDICNLTKFISVKKFPSLHWRTCRPYVVVDRFEDVTPPERVHMNNKCDRNVTIYGYLRGCNLKKGTKVHIAGVGDYSLAGVTGLADPCPLPSAAKKKGLRDKEKLFYAPPMSGLGDLLYDKDAVYININGHFVQFSNMDDENGKLNCRGLLFCFFFFFGLIHKNL